MTRQASRSGVVRELALIKRPLPKGYRVDADIVGRAHAALASPPGFAVHIPVRGDHQRRARNWPMVLRQCANPQVSSMYLPYQRGLREPLAVQFVGLEIVGSEEHRSKRRGGPPGYRFSRAHENVFGED